MSNTVSILDKETVDDTRIVMRVVSCRLWVNYVMRGK